MDPAFWMLTACVFAGNFVEAAAGFGGSIIAITFGAHYYPVERLVPVFIPVNLLLSLYLTVRYRRQIRRDELGRRILPLTTLGIFAGFALFALWRGIALKPYYGLFVICLSAFELYRLIRHPRDLQRPISRAGAAAWLLAGGILQGFFSSGGPLVVFCTARTLPDKLEFRSTMSALWLILNSILAISHVALGTINPETLKLSGLLLPPLFLGALAGDWLHHRISPRNFRLGVYALLVLAGITLLIG